MRFARLSAVTQVERNAATTQAADAISRCGGWIVDFTMFSNAMTTLRFEAPAARLPELAATLDAAEIALDADSRAALAAGFGDVGEIPGTLQLVFVHDEPDLRREVPPIPG